MNDSKNIAVEFALTVTGFAVLLAALLYFKREDDNEPKPAQRTADAGGGSEGDGGKPAAAKPAASGASDNGSAKPAAAAPEAK